MSNIKCMNCMDDFDESLGDICPHCGQHKGRVSNNPFAIQPGTTLKDRYLFGNVKSFNSTEIQYIGWDNFRARKVKIREFFPKRLCSRRDSTAQVEVFVPTSPMFNKAKFIFENRARLIMNQAADISGMAAVLDIVQENNTAYIISEYAQGVSLERLIQQKQFTWTDLKDVFEPLMQTVSALHSRGIVLGSISPSTIIVSRSGSVTFGTFDIRNEDKVSASLSVHDEENDYCAAIEFYRNGAALTPATDVYALAAAMYTAFTHNPVPLACDRIKSDSLVAPSKLGLKLNAGVETALLNALAVEPGDRTDSVQTLLKELFVERRFLGRLSARMPKITKKTVVIAVCVFAVLFGAIVTTCVLFEKAPTQKESALYVNVEGKTLDKAKEEIQDWEDKVNNQLNLSGDDRVVATYNINAPVKTDKKKYKNKKIVATQTPPGDTVYSLDGREVVYELSLYEYEKQGNHDDTMVTIPNFVGEKEDKGKVKKQLKKLETEYGISFKFLYDYSDRYVAGEIMDQSLEEGKYEYGNLQDKGPLLLTVSLGKQSTTTSTYPYKTNSNRSTTSSSTTTAPPTTTTAPTQTPTTTAPTQTPTTAAPTQTPTTTAAPTTIDSTLE